MAKAKDPIRGQLVHLLESGDAHITFDDAVSGFPAKLRGVKPEGAPHTAWQLLEHMRLAQWDIVDFTRNPKYVAKKFPDDYWPASSSPPDSKAWNKSIAAFKKDLRAMQQIIEDQSNDLFAKIPHGDGQTVFREAVLLADHNAYHLGQLMALRRMLNSVSDG